MQKMRPLYFSLVQIAIGCIFGGIFLLLFHGLQQEGFYRKTLGAISENYENRGDMVSSQIVKVKKPFVELSEDNLRHWDADIYRCIRERMYDTSEGCYNHIRPAFFPMFPWVWKISGQDCRGISVLNYLIFLLSLILIPILFRLNREQGFFIFLVSLISPQLIFFIIPYSEAVFILLITLAMLGLVRRWRLLYFVAIIAAAMARPAAMFCVPAMLAADGLLIRKNVFSKSYFKDLIIRILPFLIGYMAVTGIQFAYTHSWHALSEAQSYWQAHLQWPRTFTDWSIEGFGMSVFAACFISIPAAIILTMKLIRRQENNVTTLLPVFQAKQTQKEEYIFLFSLAYCALMFLYILFWKGGGLQSFSRYILASPCFYFILAIGGKKLPGLSFRRCLVFFLLPLIILALSLKFLNYGGSRFSFEYAGMYLLVLVAFLFYFQQLIPKTAIYILVVLAGVGSLFWTAYLLNDYLSSGWLFT